MNDWQLLNNWFVNNARLQLENINWSLTKYENTNMNPGSIFSKYENIAVFINCLLMSINAL